MNREDPGFALRFHAYWEWIEQRSILTMPLAEFEPLLQSSGSEVTFDVARTPLRRVALDSQVVGSLLKQSSTASGEIEIYRLDPADPKPYNRDRYIYWRGLPSTMSVDPMIVASATSANENFQSYARDTAFLIKTEPGPGHWLDEHELPASIRAGIQRIS
jgi:hypothetical protein